MKKDNDLALKEWAAVVRALHSGRQIILLRKGGLAEKKHKFDLEGNEFFLYPTYHHQDTHLLGEPFSEEVERINREQIKDGNVGLDTYAEVRETRTIRNPNDIPFLLSHSIWSAPYLEKRFQYKPEIPLYLLVLRAYRLPSPHIIPELPRYGGCVSWVPLDKSLTVEGAEPVLSNADFEKKCKAVLAPFPAGA